MKPTDPLYGSEWYLSQLGTLNGARLIERIWNGSLNINTGSVEAALDTVTWFPTAFDPNWNTAHPLVHNPASDLDML